MGDRAQLKMADSGVYLYTHWGGHNLPELVQSALAREERWNDHEYLSRIIFSEMVRGDIDSATGYGIGTERHGDVYRVIEISALNQTVTMKYLPYEGEPEVEMWSFEEYVELDNPEWL